jgi:hypothetical protein
MEPTTTGQSWAKRAAGLSREKRLEGPDGMWKKTFFLPNQEAGMGHHRHEFVESYAGMVGYGMDRETDEATVQIYLQKFSDDEMMRTILPRLSESELGEVFDLVSRLMHRHLKEREYHKLFLKRSREEEN